MVKEININFSDDAAYRYKMPEIEVRSVGRGNGIKAVIDNMRALAAALGRDPHVLTKYFGKSLGARSVYEESSGFATFNGSPTFLDLNTHLKQYILTFVLCRKCQNPETHFRGQPEEKPRALIMDCASCGHSEDVTGTHEFSSYLLRILSGSGEKGAAKVDRKAEKFQPTKQLRPVISSFLKEKEPRQIEAFVERILEECEDLVESDRINTDEIPALLVAALLDRHALDEGQFAMYSPVFEAVMEEEEPQREVIVLYALELLIRKYADTFENHGNVSAILQQAYAHLSVSKESCLLFAGEDAEPICPAEYHTRIVEMGSMFFEWLASQDDEGSDSYEDEYSSDGEEEGEEGDDEGEDFESDVE